MDSFEEKLKKIADSQAFAPDDELTALIRETMEADPDELMEDDLTWVTAAAKPDFEKFKKFRDRKNR